MLADVDSPAFSAANVEFDLDLIKRYDQAGPRYTSYPTAVSFTEDFGVPEYTHAALQSNDDPIPRPLSLYFHIPFCDTVCFYCACNKIATKDHSLSREYLLHLYQEIAVQGALFDPDRRVDQLHFGGGTPTFLNTDEFTELMKVIGRHFNLRDDEVRDYSIEIDPRSVTKDDIATLARLGFNRFSLGVQDVNPEVQKAVNRIQPIELTAEILQACRDYGGHSINVDLIYGLPHQTLERFATTLDTIIELSPDRLSVFNYAHLPHMFKPQRRINEQDLPPAEEKLDILKLAIDKLTAAGYVYIGMDHFAKPNDELVRARETGNLHRNFQGYSTHGGCDLIGMGVSSISSIQNVYSQNVKEIQPYYDSLGTGRLPVLRGLELDRDDIIRRYVIQKLTCYFSLDRDQVASRFDIDFDKYFDRELGILKNMQDDGLLEIGSQKIRVLARGRLLIRNICMAFDASLRKKSAQQRFSRVI